MAFLSVTSRSLSVKTDAILGVFNKTVEKLSKVVDKAQKEAIKKQEEIDKAALEKAGLERVASRAQSVITKMNSFISSDDETTANKADEN